MKKALPTGHPGAYVRENIIPRSLDLKGVAKIMGVRYSALRRFLMCETALSPELAERLELHWKKANARHAGPLRRQVPRNIKLNAGVSPTSLLLHEIVEMVARES